MSLFKNSPLRNAVEDLERVHRLSLEKQGLKEGGFY
jgi:hypothetical protein